MTTKGLQLMACMILAATVPVYGSSEVAPPAKATMEFRIAANPADDAVVVTRAKASAERYVYENGRPVAKWVPILEGQADKLKALPSLVTRSSERGDIELLVMLSPNDLTEEQVTMLTAGRDMYGKLAISVHFSEEGSSRIGMLTAEYIGRHLAEIVDGYVYGAPKIQTTVYDRAMITGEFTEEMIADLAKRLDADWAGEVDRNRRIFLTLWHLIAATAVLIVIVLAVRRAPQLHVGRIWIIGGAIMAAVVGGYWLGVTKTYGSAPIGGNFMAIETRINVSLLHLFIGAALGSIVGGFGGYLFRRAIHNATRLLTKQSHAN